MAETRSSRRSKSFLLGFVVILAALPLGWYVFLYQPPAPPPPPPPPPAPVEEVQRPVELQLAEIQGTVEVRHADGAWEPAKPGATLRASDAVRTLDGSYAVLVDGQAVEVRMESTTEVSVEELTTSLSRILLGNGMATARVRPGARAGARHTFEVRATGSDAVTRTQDGTFTVSNDGAGTVAVGTREGEVSFLGHGKVVIVRAGQQSILLPGRGPSDPTPVPSSLLLKVNWPARSTVSRRKIVLTGQAEPGSRIEVAGHTLSPDSSGRFSHTVVLSEGRQEVHVRARAVGGGEEQDHRPLTVDTTPPDVGLDQNLWK